MKHLFKNSILLSLSLAIIANNSSGSKAMLSEDSEASEHSSSSYYSDESSSKEDTTSSTKSVKDSVLVKEKDSSKENSSTSYSKDDSSEDSHGNYSSEHCSEKTTENFKTKTEKISHKRNLSVNSKDKIEDTPIMLKNSRRKSICSSFYIDPDDLVPDSILKSPKGIIQNRIKNKHVELSVSAPSVVETTPGHFLIDVGIENKTDEQIENISIGIAFHNGDELSLIPPVPEVKDISLLHNKRFSFNVNVDQINNENKRSSFCVYLYSYGSDGTRADVPYLISSYTQQIHLNQSRPKKAIIVVPGICGSELFSNSAQVIDGNQYSRGYRIWPPEGAMHIVDSGIMCGACSTITTDSERLLNDFRLIACNEDGSSKADVMPINPIIDCSINTENRNFGSVNCYGNLVENLVNSQFLHDYQKIFFSYDWRLSNEITGQLLNNFIEEQKFSSVVIVAHSMGGLVCSSYVKHCSDTSKIDKIILLGSPIHGSAKAFAAMEKGTFFDGIVGLVSSPVSHPFVKNLARSCPSIYELLPPRQSFGTPLCGYLFEHNGSCGFSKEERYDADDYEDSCELIKLRNPSTETENLLAHAQQFHDSLYDEDGVFILNKGNLDVYNLVGFNSKTSKGFYVKITRHGTKCKLTDIECNGDGTVSLSSSTIEGTFPLDKTYFAKNVNHMSLITNNNCIDLVTNIIANRPEEFNPYVIQKFTPQDEVTCGGCLPILTVLECK